MERSISRFSTKSALAGALFSSKIDLLSLKFTSLNNSLSVSYFNLFVYFFNSLLSGISSAKITLYGSVLSELDKSLACFCCPLSAS